MLSQIKDFKGKVVTRKKEREKKTSYSISVLSGKGGVGKSIFSLNFALLLQELNQKVLLMDADPGMPDLNIMMGVTPSKHWGMMVEGKFSLNQVKVPYTEKMDFVHGFSGVSKLSWMNAENVQNIMDSIVNSTENYHFSVFDVGAGVGEANIAFATNVDLTLLVLSNELTSLADAYGTIKTIRKFNPYQNIAVLVNQASREEALNVYKNLCQVTQQFLGIEPSYLGNIPKDDMVPMSVLKQKPLILDYPESEFAKSLKKVGKRICQYLKE